MQERNGKQSFSAFIWRIPSCNLALHPTRPPTRPPARPLLIAWACACACDFACACLPVRPPARPPPPVHPPARLAARVRVPPARLTALVRMLTRALSPICPGFCACASPQASQPSLPPIVRVRSPARVRACARASARQMSQMADDSRIQREFYEELVKSPQELHRGADS
jgi:hypothetical protein